MRGCEMGNSKAGHKTAQPRSIPLQRFIYRTLTLRLALMAFAIGLLTAGVAYVVI